MSRLVPALALLVVLTGCAGAPATPPDGSASPLVTPASTAPGSGSPAVPGAASTPAARTIAIRLANGTVSPNGARVDLAKGDAFVLDITSDRDDEVHVHGFEKEIPVSAGKRVTVAMVADRTGRYEIESHHPEMLIAVLQIR